MSKVFLLLVILLVLPFLSAQYEQNSEIDIKISCLDVNCSEQVNITVIYPNTSIAISNLPMTSNSGYVNYTFTNTSTLGEYTYITNNGFKDNFMITPSGNFPITTGEGITLLGSVMIIIFLGLGSLYGSFKSEEVAPKTFFFFGGIILFFTAIIYNTLIVNQVLSNSNLISGFETFYYVMATFMGVSILGLIIFTFITLVRAWKIKRGRLD